MAFAVPVRAGQVSLQDKMVWAHAMIVFPLDLNVLKPWAPDGWESLYPRYPLDTRRNWPGGNWQLPDVRAAKAAGVDGFAVDIFTNGSAANGYLDAADEAGGFQIAPCLDLGTIHGGQAEREAAALKATLDYCHIAAGHPSAAKIGDDFLIFTYGTSSLPPEAWQRVRDGLAQAGCKTYWMPDLDMGATGIQKVFPAAKIASYFPVFESGYLFGGPGRYWKEAVALFKAHGKPFGGGMMPGYERVGAGYADARGTAAYRAEWAQQARSGIPWAMVVTWNDLSENTEIMPNSDWNLTRSELTCWEAARWKGEAPPWKEPRLYLTTPQMLYPGTSAPVEALVLNGGAGPVTVRVVLLKPDGTPWGLDATAVVAGGHDGAATASLTIRQIPARRFLRARATMSVGGKVLASVLSAPILVPDRDAQPGIRTLYYSTPARQALPGKVGITVDGVPLGGKTATARALVPPGIAPQFSEVLFNGEILKNFLAQPPTPLMAPVQVGRATVTPDGANVLPAGAIKGGTEWGFYLSRVTDSRYRVGYSDPIYFAPPGDLSLKESYSFDESAGMITADASVYRRAGDLQDVIWVKPGADGKGACVRFNGRSSRVNLSVAGTPSGPFSLKIAVRPRQYGGMFFCDSGGLWVTTTQDGRPEYTRLGPTGWVSAYGKTPIPLGQWTRLECTWDGHTSRIFVNGVLAGESICPPRFTSDRRALGCNPFGSGSGYYDGDIDNFEIRAYSTDSRDAGH
jgi:hypothetical protein